MKILRKILFVAILICFSNEAKALNVFTCEPEWASLVEEIAGDKVKTFSATTAFQDVHYIQARPSLIANMRKADLVVCSGAGLEDGWLPILLQKAGKSSVQTGGKASILATKYIKTLEKPTRVDRSDGDIHPEGNPHIHLNPNNITEISNIVLEKLIYLDYENKDFYKANHSNFIKRWQAHIQSLEKKAKNLKGINVISRHKNFTYLLDWLEINNVGTLEPKPGVPPTSKHLSELVEVVKNEDVKLIMYAPFEAEKSAKWLSNKTNVSYVLLPYTIGGSKKSTNLFDLFSETVSLLNQTLENK